MFPTLTITGNEFRRIVEPTFATSRNGEEYIKILRGTRCLKDGIDVNRLFRPSLQIFINLEQTTFLIKKRATKGSIFVELMKSLLPDFDVKKAQLQLKSLKKTRRETD